MKKKKGGGKIAPRSKVLSEIIISIINNPPPFFSTLSLIHLDLPSRPVMFEYTNRIYPVFQTHQKLDPPDFRKVLKNPVSNIGRSLELNEENDHLLVGFGEESQKNGLSPRPSSSRTTPFQHAFPMHLDLPSQPVVFKYTHSQIS